MISGNIEQSDCTFDNNIASNSGGGLYMGNGTVVVTNCSFSNNSAKSNGGAVYNGNGSLILETVTFHNNSINYTGSSSYHTSRGGAIYAVGLGNFSNCIFTNNSIEVINTYLNGDAYGEGGGIYFNGGLTLINCLFNGHSIATNGGGGDNAFSFGGGVFATGQSIMARDCDFYNNLVFTHSSSGDERSHGGAIHISTTTATVEACSFSNNSANGSGTCYGGGIIINSGSSFLACVIENNSAATTGGGLYNTGTSETSLENCLITGNSAAVSTGGVYTNGTSLTLSNCTFADGYNGGITQAAGSLIVENSIIYGNQGAQIIGTATVTYSDVEGGFVGEGNIDANPAFGDNYFLSTGSQCIDAGNPGTEYDDLCFGPSQGDLRNDMGAYGGPGACNWLGVIDIPVVLHADFSADILTGIPDLTVHFTDLSAPTDTTEIISWQWDFDNDNVIDSDQQNPTWTYSQVGDYTVSLSVSDGISEDTEIKDNYIHVITGIFVALDTVTAFSSSSVLLPVNVVFPEGETFSSLEMSFSGFQGSLDFIDVITDTGMVGDANWSIEVNETEDLILIASAGSQDISGEGLLFHLEFSVPDTASGFIPIVIESAVFNTGENAVIIGEGGVNVFSITYGDVDENSVIQAYDASLILKYLVEIVELDTFQIANANVSLDSTISALDASLILQYVVELIDSLPYDTSSGLLFASGDVGMEDGKIQPGQIVEVPLYLSNGDNILSFEGLVIFNPEHLNYDEVVWSEILDEFAIEVNVEEGEIKVAGAGAVPDGQEGVFAILRFIADANFEEDYTTVALQRLRWNEEPVVENVAAATLTNVLVVDHEGFAIPSEFMLNQNYPNPFNPVTTIHYELPERSHVSILIYDISGRHLRLLVNEKQDTGYKTVIWGGTNDQGNNVGTGVYLYRIQAGNYTTSRKMVLLR